MPIASRCLLLHLLLPLILASGCSTPKPVNPSFPLTFDQARHALHDMEDHPVPLQRPLVIVGGYLDPNVSPPLLKSRFRKLTGDARIIGVPVGFYSNFEDCRRKVIEAVDHAYPSTDPQWTVEVDVIGASLGGLVARYAAAPSRDPTQTKRLRVARMFTIASPHSGAVLTKTATLNQLQADMKPGSPFLQYLESCDPAATYQLFPYARLNDGLVGAHYAAPPTQTPLWLAPPPLQGGHSNAWFDDRILADIARRLRGETPFSSLPPAALPPKK